MIETREFNTDRVCSYDIDEFVRDFIARLPVEPGTIKVTLEFIPAEVPS